MELKYLKRIAKEHGVEYKDLGNGHIQLKGVLLVNYYPFSKNKTAYVAGTTIEHTRATFTHAVKLCNKPCENIGKTSKRRGNSKKQRIALLKKGINTCYWCTCALTLETSTIEHIIPIVKGGLDNAHNRTLACKPCNNNRGSDMSGLFKEVEI